MFDLLVLGSGVAGLSAAVRAHRVHGLATAVVTKDSLEVATTRWAQGGVAAAMSGERPDIVLHLEDTLAAGAGLCDVEAVEVLVGEGPQRLEELISLGANFDRDTRGDLEFAREGGHSVARVVHAGGVATGAEIERALVEATRAGGLILHENTFATDLLIEGGRCVGVTVFGPGGDLLELRARHVLLATGGAGQLYSVTTNPSVATGDGVAMALRAGVATADLEFFQFHPTALHRQTMPRPLLSEALRGDGAKLRDANGERFIDELLPRDIVSRAIHAKMLEEGSEHVWLDATEIHDFAERFPTITADLELDGLDPAKDWLPVAPAAHHQCGGIVTDLNGATTLPGLWAAGETSCTGVHGANRLASNSLLEGMVFGPRAVDAIAEGVDGPSATGVMRVLLSDNAPWLKVDPILAAVRSGDGTSLQPGSLGGVFETDPTSDASDVVRIEHLREELQTAMFRWAGVQRDVGSLVEAAGAIRQVMVGLGDPARLPIAGLELRNLALVGWVLVSSALAREESRGTHARTDFPDRDPAFAHRFFV